MLGEDGDAGEEAILPGGIESVDVANAALDGCHRYAGLDSDRFDLVGRRWPILRSDASCDHHAGKFVPHTDECSGAEKAEMAGPESRFEVVLISEGLPLGDTTLKC